jgi:hypothetical protein
MPISRVYNAGPSRSWKVEVTATKLATFNQIRRELRRHKYEVKVSTREDLDELLDKLIQQGTEILASLPKLDPLPEKKVKAKVTKKARVRDSISDISNSEVVDSTANASSSATSSAGISRAMDFLKPD